ncbi:hypothetical protein H0H81_000201 [Sphagnurus paluster]|uniref:Uncharacterized protein n=1 Tax=Sphagnurus paluster TaxID=117069 RepID=A0A9P7K3I6_9AGAR|nr:hypothetical protein H0H81_000201 [Sphagnurus paluster]
MPPFPWDSLKADTLRGLCRDLQQSKLTTRSAMIDFLTKVEEHGVEEALILQVAPSTSKIGESTPTRSPATKRSRLGPVVSDYDTRHKKSRRSDSGPLPPRRKPRNVKDTATVNGSSAPKRLGRPPKNKGTTTPPSVPVSTGRQLFDGVVLASRTPHVSKGKAKARELESGDEDADGDIEMDDSLVYPDDIPRAESSLASSNKENESIFGDLDANPQSSIEAVEDDVGNTPTRGGILASVVQTAVPVMEDEDVDAEGETVDEDAEPNADHQKPVLQGKVLNNFVQTTLTTVSSKLVFA